MNLEEVNKKVDKEFPNLVLQGESLVQYRVPRIPTGLFIFDLLSGGGVPESKYIKFWGAKSSGKCITGDSLVLTSSGLSSIDGYSNGLSGLSEMEVPLMTKEGVQYSSHFFEEVANETVYVKNNLGMSIEGTPEHKLFVFNSDLSFSFKRLDDIQVGDYVCIPRGTNLFPSERPAIHFKQTIISNNGNPLKEVPHQITPSLARLLGYIIANGNYNKTEEIRVSTTNKRIVEDIQGILSELGQSLYSQRGIDHKIGGRHLGRLLYFLLDSPTAFTARYKKVPNIILSSPKEIQYSFLQALIDCDGYMSKEGHLSFYSASKLLADQVQLMLLNLGIICTKTYKEKAKTKEKTYYHRYYSVSICSNSLSTYFDNIASLKYKVPDIDVHARGKDIVPYYKALLDKAIKDIRTYLKVDAAGGYYKDGVYVRNGFTLGSANHYGSKNITRDHLKRIYPILSEWCSYGSIQFLLDKKEEILNSNFYFSKIVEVERRQAPVHVYDFTVPNGHNFIANGFINHNTVFSLICAGNYQKLNPDKYVLLIDYENAYDPNVASLVLDINRLILVQPEYAEQGIELHKQYLQAEEVGFVIVDSLGFMTPLTMAEADATKEHVGDLTKVVNKMFRQTESIIRNAIKNGRSITTILISQVRASIGAAMFGGDSVAGGKLAEHMPSMEVRFYSGINKKKYKNNYKFTIVKNRGGLQRVSGDYSAYVKDADGHKKGGLDQVKAVLTYAKRAGILCQNKGKLQYGDIEVTIDELLGSSKLLDSIKDATLNYYLENDVLVTEEDDS